MLGGNSPRKFSGLRRTFSETASWHKFALGCCGAHHLPNGNLGGLRFSAITLVQECPIKMIIHDHPIWYHKWGKSLLKVRKVQKNYTGPHHCAHYKGLSLLALNRAFSRGKGGMPLDLRAKKKTQHKRKANLFFSFEPMRKNVANDMKTKHGKHPQSTTASEEISIL